MFSYTLVQSKQPCIPLHKKCLTLIDLIQQRSVKMSFLSPKILLTKNRKDIEYRVGFLRSVLESGLSLQNTLYYQFIADHDKTITEDAEMASKDFISLYHNIKNGINLTFLTIVIFRMQIPIIRLNPIKRIMAIERSKVNRNICNRAPSLITQSGKTVAKNIQPLLGSVIIDKIKIIPINNTII